MAEGTEYDVQTLFKRWRAGDADAGQRMAQKFSDWYYAVTAIRLGDRDGRQPLEQACTAFAQGITTVSRPGELVDWAYGLVLLEVQSAGGRVNGGDFPNALTGHRSPTELLRGVAAELDGREQKLINMTYSPETPLDDLIREAEAQGGWPLSVLTARYKLKRALHATADVPFSVVPEQPNLDRAPLPLYEAGRMANPEEESFFEKWLVTDLDLCKDVAEFATFAHALRAGAFTGSLPSSESQAPAQKPVSAPVTSSEPSVRSAERVEGTSKAPMLLIVLGGMVLLGLFLAAVALFLTLIS